MTKFSIVLFELKNIFYKVAFFEGIDLVYNIMCNISIIFVGKLFYKSV